MGKKIYVSGPRKNAIYVRSKPSAATRYSVLAFKLKNILLNNLKHKFIDLYLFNKN